MRIRRKHAVVQAWAEVVIRLAWAAASVAHRDGRECELERGITFTCFVLIRFVDAVEVCPQRS